MRDVEVVLGRLATTAARRSTRGRCGSRRTRRPPAAAARAATARARPACATSSGRPASSICSRSSLISACVSSSSPSSCWIAFSCSRRKYSRCVLSISDWTCDWIFEPSSITSSSRASISESRRSRFVTFALLEQLLLLLGLDPQRAGDHVAERLRVVDVRDRDLQLLGQVRNALDDAREGRLDVARERLELGRELEHVRLLVDARDQVGLARRRTRRSARAGRPARGSAACRRASSACARRRRRRRPGRRRPGPAARPRGPCWRPSRACGRVTARR